MTEARSDWITSEPAIPTRVDLVNFLVQSLASMVAADDPFAGLAPSNPSYALGSHKPLSARRNDGTGVNQNRAPKRSPNEFLRRRLV